MRNHPMTVSIPQGGFAQITTGFELIDSCVFPRNLRVTRFYICAFILLCAGKLSGQNFHAEGTFPKVDSNGFYRIMISPDATAFMNERLSNLRIHDSAGKEVPYLLEEEQPTYSREQFKEYPIIEKKQVKGCCTSLTLSNPEKKSINNIRLVIRNAEVSKRATLLGSDDKKEWFALKEQFFLQSINNASGIAEVKLVEFPLNNYSFLSLRMDDSTSAPLNILKAGYYDRLTASGVYTEIPIQRITTQDSVSLKKTYIYINLDATFIVDKVEFAMKGSPYFLREAQLWQMKSRETREGEEKFYELVSAFQVSSTQSSIVHLPALKTNAIRIVIDNEDNPSLNVASAKVYQLNRYLVAWLKKDEQYTVKFGDEKIIQPDYDLTFFKDSIPAQPPVLKLDDITRLASEVHAEASQTFFTTRNFIWMAIIAVIAVLGFLSVRLIREASGSHHEKEN